MVYLKSSFACNSTVSFSQLMLGAHLPLYFSEQVYLMTSPTKLALLDVLLVHVGSVSKGEWVALLVLNVFIVKYENTYHQYVICTSMD